MNEQNSYLEIVAFVEGRDGKKRAIRCGRARVNPNGEVSIWLDSVPTHPTWDGSFKAAIPRERTDAPSGGGARTGAGGQRPVASHGRAEDDSELPF